MPGDPVFFKSVSFLTCLVKGKRLKYFLKYGFTREDLIKEVEKAIEDGLSYSSDTPYNYKEKIINDIDEVIRCLIKEDLISYENDAYYLEDRALDVADFMLDLSSIITHSGSVTEMFSKDDKPFRKYPGSNQEYGLN